MQQRAALQSQIWKIANDVRGSVDGWDFKQYVLGTLFYRFISAFNTAAKRKFLSLTVFPKRLLVVSKSANRPLMSTSDR
jgi:type I restriction-modification system DNA methylase subunit